MSSNVDPKSLLEAGSSYQQPQRPSSGTKNISSSSEDLNQVKPEILIITDFQSLSSSDQDRLTLAGRYFDYQVQSRFLDYLNLQNESGGDVSSLKNTFESMGTAIDKITFLKRKKRSLGNYFEEFIFSLSSVLEETGYSKNFNWSENKKYYEYINLLYSYLNNPLNDNSTVQQLVKTYVNTTANYPTQINGMFGKLYGVENYFMLGLTANSDIENLTSMNSQVNAIEYANLNFNNFGTVFLDKKKNFLSDVFTVVNVENAFQLFKVISSEIHYGLKEITQERVISLLGNDFLSSNLNQYSGLKSLAHFNTVITPPFVDRVATFNQFESILPDGTKLLSGKKEVIDKTLEIRNDGTFNLTNFNLFKDKLQSTISDIEKIRDLIDFSTIDPELVEYIKDPINKILKTITDPSSTYDNIKFSSSQKNSDVEKKALLLFSTIRQIYGSNKSLKIGNIYSQKTIENAYKDIKTELIDAKFVIYELFTLCYQNATDSIDDGTLRRFCNRILGNEQGYNDDIPQESFLEQAGDIAAAAGSALVATAAVVGGTLVAAGIATVGVTIGVGASALTVGSTAGITSLAGGIAAGTGASTVALAEEAFDTTDGDAKFSNHSYISMLDDLKHVYNFYEDKGGGERFYERLHSKDSISSAKLDEVIKESSTWAGVVKVIKDYIRLLKILKEKNNSYFNIPPAGILSTVFYFMVDVLSQGPVVYSHLVRHRKTNEEETTVTNYFSVKYKENTNVIKKIPNRNNVTFVKEKSVIDNQTVRIDLDSPNIQTIVDHLYLSSLKLQNDILSIEKDIISQDYSTLTSLTKYNTSSFMSLSESQYSLIVSKYKDYKSSLDLVGENSKVKVSVLDGSIIISNMLKNLVINEVSSWSEKGDILSIGLAPNFYDTLKRYSRYKKYQNIVTIKVEYYDELKKDELVSQDYHFDLSLFPVWDHRKNLNSNLLFRRFLKNADGDLLPSEIGIASYSNDLFDIESPVIADIKKNHKNSFILDLYLMNMLGTQVDERSFFDERVRNFSQVGGAVSSLSSPDLIEFLVTSKNKFDRVFHVFIPRSNCDASIAKYQVSVNIFNQV